MKKILIVAIHVWCITNVAHGQMSSERPGISSGCPAAFGLALTATENFMAYLAELVEYRIIADRELVRFKTALEQGELVNPITEQQGLTSSASLIHRNGIEKHLNKNKTNLDLEKLLTWTEKTLKEKEHVRVRREETKVVTADIYQKIEFNRVEPGEFMMGDEGTNKVKVILTKPFELMSTPVTQKRWAMIMGENPSHFIGGPDSIIMNINGKQIKMRPDNPVEQVSWKDSKRFIARLNELSQAEDPMLRELIVGHNRGDQYRLPTEAEWEYVVIYRGRAREDCWHCGDGESTYPVGQSRPLMVDGKAFYDFYGNVGEWVEDLYGDLQGGIDPQGPATGTSRIFCGDSWNNMGHHRNRYAVGPGAGVSYVGLRLVRITSHNH